MADERQHGLSHQHTYQSPSNHGQIRNAQSGSITILAAMYYLKKWDFPKC